MLVAARQQNNKAIGHFKKVIILTYSTLKMQNQHKQDIFVYNFRQEIH